MLTEMGGGAYPALPPVLGSSAVRVLTSVLRDTPGFFKSSLSSWILSPLAPSVCYIHTDQPAAFTPHRKILLNAPITLPSALKLARLLDRLPFTLNAVCF